MTKIEPSGRAGVKAGASAQRKYLAARRRWWRRVGRPARIALSLLMLAGIALSLLPRVWVWTGGAVFGASLMLLLDLWDAPPRHIENWRRGAEGERQVARTLRPLTRRGWHVFHDLASDYGNIDHLIVGPPGVFLIETKNWHGIKTIDRDQITVTFIDEPDSKWHNSELGRRVRAASAEFSEILHEATGRKPWVQGVIALCGEFPQGSYDYDKVTYIQAELIRTWLDKLPPVLTPGRVIQLSGAIDKGAQANRKPAGRI